ncbi:fumarylacetoacetate hydrolase family protein [Bacillaceae bacterium W0354]
MKFVAFKTGRVHLWGVLKGNDIYYSDKLMTYFPNLLSVVENYSFIDFEHNFSKVVPLSEVEVLPPFLPRKNVMCIGKNYREHALEMTGNDESQIPEKPVIFTKSPTSIIGNNDVIESHQSVTSALDYEGELAVIIGKAGRNISREQALDYVFGYTIINDVTARDLQQDHKQYFRGKSLDTFCPFGPILVHRDEIEDVQSLSIKTYVNDELRQDGNTKDMIFPVAELIEVLSNGMTLQSGDIIATGTPSGVGKGFNPPKFLQPGDEVRIELEGIGELINRVK